MPRWPNMPDTIERFWAKVEKSESCWKFTGATNARGYGSFFLDGRQQVASRAAYQLLVGPIPDGFNVCHRCDNPQCVRPDHLFAGTDRDNMRDMSRKGRQVFQRHPERCPRGADASNAKLTEIEVEQIRREYAAGGITQTELAKRFGISQGYAARLINRVHWAD